MTFHPVADESRHARVVVLCSTAWGIRNLVPSGLLASLRAELDVQLVSSSSASNVLTEACEASGDHSLLHSEPPRHDPLGVVLNASFAQRYGLRSYGSFQSRYVREPGLMRPAWRRLVSALAVAGARQPLLDWQIAGDRKRARRRHGMEAIRAQLRAIAPGLVVSTSPVVPEEAAYARAAEELGIPSLGCILSFDNLSSRGRQPSFSHYAVWSRRMGDEVLRLYPDHDASQVHVTGTPQFDLHRQARIAGSRQAALASLGLEDGQRYVLYAANCARFTPTEPELVRALCRRLSEMPATSHHRLVLRPHPADELSRWTGIAGTEPSLVFAAPQGTDGRFGTTEAQTKLVSSVAHADACVNMASTMSLDAAVLDVPVVCVGFALHRGSVEDRLAAACHRTTHYEPVIASGGVRLAGSLDELTAEIAEYVIDRTRDRSARARLVAEMCGPVDGGAASRLAQLIGRLAAPEPAAAGWRPTLEPAGRETAGRSW